MGIRKIAWVSAAVALLVTGVAVAGAAGDKTVQITDQGFVPDRIEVMVGEKVVFQNMTQKDHTVSSKKPIGRLGQEKDQDKDREKEKNQNQDKDKDKDKDKADAGFDSGLIKARTSWEHTFTKPGTYAYYCKEDKSMVGTIVVLPAK